MSERHNIEDYIIDIDGDVLKRYTVESITIRPKRPWWKFWQPKYTVHLSFTSGGGPGWIYDRVSKEEAEKCRDVLIKEVFEVENPRKNNE